MNPHRLTIAQQLAPAEVEPETPEADPLDYVVGGIFPLWLAAQICQPVTAARNRGDKTVPSIMLVERLAQCRNMDVEVSLFRGILTNIVMTLSGLPMHKSIGRAAAAGVVVACQPPLQRRWHRKQIIRWRWAASTSRCGLVSPRPKPPRLGLVRD